MNVIQRKQNSLWGSALLQYNDEFVNSILASKQVNSDIFRVDENGYYQTPIGKIIDTKFKFYDNRYLSSRSMSSDYFYEHSDDCACDVEYWYDCDCDVMGDYCVADEDVSHLTVGDIINKVVIPYQILKMKDCDKPLLTSLIDSMAQEDESKLSTFGLVLVYKVGRKVKRMNIFHPFIAMMIQDGQIQIPDKFTIIMYPFKGDRTFDVDNDDYIDCITKTSEVINDVKAHLFDGTSKEVKLENIKEGSSQIDVGTTYYSFSGTAGGEDKISIVPNQLLVKNGIMYPHYGLIQSRVQDGNSEFYSNDLLPFRSPNINQSEEDDLNRVRITCTGDESNTIFNSMITLNVSNMGSPHHSNVYPNYWVSYVKACQQLSISYLKGNI